MSNSIGLSEPFIKTLNYILNSVPFKIKINILSKIGKNNLGNMHNFNFTDILFKRIFYCDYLFIDKI